MRAYKNGNYACPYCAGKKVKRENSFASLHPEVMDEYDPTNTIDPYSVTEKSNKSVSWICRNDPSHKWKAPFGSRAEGQGACPSCRGYTYGRMLIDEMPWIKDYYDEELNDHALDSFTLKSNDYIHLVCDQGHRFRRKVYNLREDLACPVCSNRQLLTGENDLQTAYPDVAREFDSEKNGTTPDKVLCVGYDPKIWWKCANGHSYQWPISSRVARGKCPVCDGTLVVPGINDLASAYPVVKDIWDYTNNAKMPEEVYKDSNISVAVICERGHRYKAFLHTLRNNGFKCLVCTNQITVDGYNSLKDTSPWMLDFWDDENNDRGPEMYNVDSGVRVSWKCPVCGGIYTREINNMQEDEDNCPYCSDQKTLPGFNDLLTLEPELAKEYSPENIIPVQEVRRTLAYSVKWVCSTCGGPFVGIPRDRFVGDDACPYCRDRKTLPGLNDLATLKPALVEEYSPDNEIPVEQVKATLTTPVKWRCKTCGGTYMAVPKDRYAGDDACPYCKDAKALPGLNDIATLKPELAEEYDPENDTPIEQVKATYSVPVKWICKTCKGQFMAAPRNRFAGDEACPYCASKKVMPGYNDFQTRYPSLMGEWDFINNYLIAQPDQVLPSSTQKVWWICESCGSRYYMSPARRIYFLKRNMSPCLYEKGLRRDIRHF